MLTKLVAASMEVNSKYSFISTYSQFSYCKLKFPRDNKILLLVVIVIVIVTARIVIASRDVVVFNAILLSILSLQGNW